MTRNFKTWDDAEMTAQSFCNLSQRLKFAEEFVQMANDGAKAKEVFAFFCYFVAFNTLYGFNAGEDEFEYESIRRFLLGMYQSGSFDFHPGKSTDFPLLNGKVAQGGLDGTKYWVKEKVYIRNETNEDVRVFMRIYQIRCNLFHGDKRLNNNRDMPLIRESNEAFRRFYAEYFKDARQ